MPWGPRVAETSPVLAEGDKLYLFGVYNDVSGNLTAYMPLYKDCADAAEFDSLNPTTALTAGPLVGKATAGRVLLGKTFNSGGISAGDAPVFVGIYTPTNPSDKPSTGDVVRITRLGVTPVQISSGQNPNVGDYIQADFNQNLALTRPRGGQAPSTGAYIGRVLATTSQISLGQAITAPAAPGGFGFLINGWIDR